jgi:RND family efflux transporter MFP subunit
VGVGAYFLWGRNFLAEPAQAGTSSANTELVRVGSLVLSAEGTGTLAAGEEVELSFSTSGTVGGVNVRVGDKVEEGDVLAELADTESLLADVTDAQLALDEAQQALDDLRANAGAALAEAQLAVAVAQEAYYTAQGSLKWEGLARCDEDTTDAYYDEYLRLQQELDRRFPNYSTSDSNYLAEIKPLETERNTAYNAYTYCTGFYDYEILASQAQATKTTAELDQANAALETLQANAGIDQDALAAAENTLANAMLALAQAQKTLQGAAITAPFSGTVMSVAGSAGDEVSGGAFITLADLAHPRVQFYVDESDIAMVALGYPADVVFDAFPDTTFTGTVVMIDPSLTSLSGASTLTGTIELELDETQQNLNLPKGLNSAVEIIGGEAENALLVPVEALTTTDDGQYAVYVVGNDAPRSQIVEVGLMDYTYAEIKSGLEQGELVMTDVGELN